MSIPWAVMGEALVIAWENVVSDATPLRIVTAITLFNGIAAYAIRQSVTERQLITLCITESAFVLTWAVSVVVLHVAKVI